MQPYRWNDIGLEQVFQDVEMDIEKELKEDTTLMVGSLPERASSPIRQTLVVGSPKKRFFMKKTHGPPGMTLKRNPRPTSKRILRSSLKRKLRSKTNTRDAESGAEGEVTDL